MGADTGQCQRRLHPPHARFKIPCDACGTMLESGSAFFHKCDVPTLWPRVDLCQTAALTTGTTTTSVWVVMACFDFTLCIRLARDMPEAGVIKWLGLGRRSNESQCPGVSLKIEESSRDRPEAHE